MPPTSQSCMEGRYCSRSTPGIFLANKQPPDESAAYIPERADHLSRIQAKSTRLTPSLRSHAPAHALRLHCGDDCAARLLKGRLETGPHLPEINSRDPPDTSKQPPGEPAKRADPSGCHTSGVVSSLVFECTACNTKVPTSGSGCPTKSLESKFGKLRS